MSEVRGAEVAGRDRGVSVEAFTLFSAAEKERVIVVPAAAIPEERRAAELIQATLAKAADRPIAQFPIQTERADGPRSAVFVGATLRSGTFLIEAPARAPFDTAVGSRVRAGAVEVKSERRESIELAASWWLERASGAHWFMPGPLGEHVPVRAELILPAGEAIARPGFISRDLSLGPEEGRDWAIRNRLESRFEIGHNLVTIFRPEDFQRRPEMAPMRSGQRFLPDAGDQNWQPDFRAVATIEHAAATAIRAFNVNPQRGSFSLSINDSIRYDDSAGTLAAVAPRGYFRQRPDYSDLVFGFANAVAARVAERHPDRWLPAFAYYWCENVPTFPVARRIVPFLTADRSQWMHPEFAAEDRALIERWCKSGAEVVGVYDYFYGAPFLIPRPTLYAVTETLPFHHRAGVRAFFAETVPNWALDGPKPWLAAQLLWAPERSPSELLAIYYREFWAEAAGPMERFFALCDQTWREQPGPARWLRYFRDDDQSTIYPAARQVELRTLLDQAARLARSQMVRARVAFASAGFSVSEQFWAFSAARDRLNRMITAGVSPGELLAAWRQYRDGRARFEERYRDVLREQPFAVATQDLAIYFRHHPDSRAARELVRTPAGRTLLEGAGDLTRQHLGATPGEVERVLTRGVETLQDRDWKSVTIRPVVGPAVFDWTEADNAWQGSGEPWESRRVALGAERDGRRTLRFAGSRTEGIGQWLPVTAGTLCLAQVDVRAKSSPGTATFLIMNFLDDKHRHLGLGRIDRLSPEAAVQTRTLVVVERAPPQARYVGIGLRVLNQLDDDFAEFSAASLRQLQP